MSSALQILHKSALVGVGGTIVLDLYAFFMARVLGVSATNWAMVGRWFGNMARGRFLHKAIDKTEPIKGELAIGWVGHYVIGLSYGLLLLALWGKAWLEQPKLLPPLALAWMLLAAPYFVMMPGMGLGVAGSRTPKPNLTRLKSVVSHSVFGLGMYATGWLLAQYWPTTA
ncbi:MAG: DUF2938 domain-containing protein [Proteobacteria bacterium]|nr:DUF2938 domain-containing protein [Pseudomonadota bacterium]